MARWHQDDVDVACEAWAYQWVQNYARTPDRAGRTVGPLGCTLGRVMERHDGAASNTEHDRTWPEVFLGQGLLVAVALHAMSAGGREITWAHYVGRVYDPTTWQPMKRPIKQRFMADRLGLPLSVYYTRRDTAKACIRTVLCLGLSPDSKLGASTPGLGVCSAQFA
jgi:hypothetical protein